MGVDTDERLDGRDVRRGDPLVRLAGRDSTARQMNREHATYGGRCAPSEAGRVGPTFLARQSARPERSPRPVPKTHRGRGLPEPGGPAHRSLHLRRSAVPLLPNPMESTASPDPRHSEACSAASAQPRLAQTAPGAPASRRARDARRPVRCTGRGSVGRPGDPYAR